MKRTIVKRHMQKQFFTNIAAFFIQSIREVILVLVNVDKVLKNVKLTIYTIQLQQISNLEY